MASQYNFNNMFNRHRRKTDVPQKNVRTPGLKPAYPQKGPHKCSFFMFCKNLLFCVKAARHSRPISTGHNSRRKSPNMEDRAHYNELLYGMRDEFLHVYRQQGQ